MKNKNLINRLAFSKENEIHTLVENKRSFHLESLELHVYETYEVAKSVPLQFDNLVLINMIQGKKVMHLENVSSFDYFPGQTMLLPAYTPMRIDFPEAQLADPTQCTALTIDKSKIDEVITYLNEFYPKQKLVGDWKVQPDLFHLYNTPDLADSINKLFSTMTSHNPLKNALADLTLKEIIIKLLQSQSLLALEIGKSTNTVFVHLKEFIKKHISEKLTIEELEKVANMSKSSLHRMFKNELGVSPMEYVIRQRLAKAKELLVATRSVKESCFASGFADVNYFVRLFKNREGVTPGAFILQN